MGLRSSFRGLFLVAILAMASCDAVDDPASDSENGLRTMAPAAGAGSQVKELPAPDIQPYLPPPSIRFDSLTVEDGLSNGDISGILQDSQGLIWIGTQDGLNRYDGYDFTVFRHDPDDPLTLRDDYIESLYEDPAGVLWVGTQDGWLEKYDRQTGTFTHYQVASHVLAMLEDGHGDFWIGSLDPGLLRFDKETGARSLIWSGREFSAIIEDRRGTLWAASPQEGLGRYDREQASFVPVPTDFPVHTLIEDATGGLWLGTWGGGIGRLDPDSGQISYYSHDPQDPNSLSDSSVSTMLQDTAGMIWVGTYHTGLDRLDPRTWQVAHFQHDPADPDSLRTNSVLSLFEDRSGVLWIGNALRGGLNKVVAEAAQFGYYPHAASATTNSSEQVITSITEDPAGVLWIGTLSGLSRWERRSGQWQHYRHDEADSQSLASDAIRSLYVDISGALWIGTEAGLDRYDAAAGRFVHYDGPTVMWMIEDDAAEFWLATKNGLYDFDRGTGEMMLVRQGHSWKIMLLEDRQGSLWVGTSGDGLEHYDPQTQEWQVFLHDPEDSHSLSNDSVEAIHEDARGTIWLGTRGGLNRFAPATQQFTHYTTKDGLPHDDVVGILEDGQGRLWLSTGNGLSRFDPQTEQFTNFGEADGLQAQLFWRNAYYQSPTGEMVFGGENGFNIFHPALIAENPRLPPVLITSLSVFNQLRRTDLGQAETVALTYQENFISFEFAALDYNDPGQNEYAYKMEGLNEDWVHIGRRRHVDFPNLQPGTYTFRVKGANEDGVWNEVGAAVRIIVQPPFWETWWFRTLVAMLGFGLLLASYRLRIRAAEARSQQLQREVVQRTIELKREVDQRMMAEAALHQSQMEQAIAAERGRLARELHDSITQALYSLTLFAEAARHRFEVQADPDSEFQLRKIGQLARQALKEMRLLIYELRPVELEQEGLVRALRRRLEAVEGRAGIQARLIADELPLLAPTVEQELYRIAQEALNNALKHAAAAHVIVYLRVDESCIELEIIDDGTGFSPHELEEMAGLGLIGIRERVQRLSGQMAIRSAPGMGTRVFVSMANPCNAEVMVQPA